MTTIEITTQKVKRFTSKDKSFTESVNYISAFDGYYVSEIGSFLSTLYNERRLDYSEKQRINRLVLKNQKPILEKLMNENIDLFN